MNKLNQNVNEQNAYSEQRAFSLQRALSVQRAFSAQRVTTVLALLLLLLAVQVSTQNVGDWFVFGLNILELTEPLSEASNVGANVGTNVATKAPEFIQKIVMALVL